MYKVNKDLCYLGYRMDAIGNSYIVQILKESCFSFVHLWFSPFGCICGQLVGWFGLEIVAVAVLIFLFLQGVGGRVSVFVGWLVGFGHFGQDLTFEIQAAALNFLTSNPCAYTYIGTMIIHGDVLTLIVFRMLA